MIVVMTASSQLTELTFKFRNLGLTTGNGQHVGTPPNLRGLELDMMSLYALLQAILFGSMVHLLVDFGWTGRFSKKVDFCSIWTQMKGLRPMMATRMGALNM